MVDGEVTTTFQLLLLIAPLICCHIIALFTADLNLWLTHICEEEATPSIRENAILFPTSLCFRLSVCCSRAWSSQFRLSSRWHVLLCAPLVAFGRQNQVLVV